MKKIVMRDWYFYELIETTIVLEKLRFIKCPFTSRQKICFHIKLICISKCTNNT